MSQNLAVQSPYLKEDRGGSGQDLSPLPCSIVFSSCVPCLGSCGLPGGTGTSTAEISNVAVETWQ